LQRLCGQIADEGHALSGRAQWDAAADRYAIAFHLMPQDEQLAAALMRTYAKAGRTHRLDAVYSTLRAARQTLTTDPPAPGIERLWRSLKTS
jgi:hypothetical protein